MNVCLYEKPQGPFSGFSGVPAQGLHICGVTLQQSRAEQTVYFLIYLQDSYNWTNVSVSDVLTLWQVNSHTFSHPHLVL